MTNQWIWTLCYILLPVFMAVLCCPHYCAGKALYTGFKTDDCGEFGWKSYGDTKCYKILTPLSQSLHLKTYNEAQKICSEQHELANLPSIESQQELQFVYSLINGSTVGNIWLGAREVNSTLVWNDGLNSNYSNWHDENFHNGQHGFQCIQIESHRTLRAKWTFTDCDHTRNFVVCQKPQSWAPSKIQRVAEETRRELSGAVDFTSQIGSTFGRLAALESKVTSAVQASAQNISILAGEVERLRQALVESTDAIEDLKRRLTNMTGQVRSGQSAGPVSTPITYANTVPIGFVYIQYGNQVSPSVLWPHCIWTEITSVYAGMFFRAEGGNSARYGIPQSDNAPRLTHVAYHDLENHPNEVQTRPGETSEAVRTGHWDSSLDKVGLVFTMSEGEVRPYNSAVKIWKRTA